MLLAAAAEAGIADNCSLYAAARIVGQRVCLRFPLLFGALCWSPCCCVPICGVSPSRPMSCHRLAGSLQAGSVCRCDHAQQSRSGRDSDTGATRGAEAHCSLAQDCTLFQRREVDAESKQCDLHSTHSLVVLLLVSDPSLAIMHPSIRVDPAEEKHAETGSIAAAGSQVSSIVSALVSGQHDHPALHTLSPEGGSPSGSPTHASGSASSSSSRRRRAALLGSNGGGMLGANLKMIDGELVPQQPATFSPRSSGGGGLRTSYGSSTGVSHFGGYNSPRGSSSAYALHHSAAASSSALPQALHPSAHALTALPSFSHEALGAYQLRIDPELHLELMSLKHNKQLTVHRKTEICLQALESLANRCIINHSGSGGAEGSANSGAAPASASSSLGLGTADANTAAILQYLGGHNFSSAAAAAAAAQAAPEAQLDGVPLSQHQAALKSTILNLRSMIVPLLVAPRQLFQEALHRAEECAVKHAAIRYETEENLAQTGTDSVRIGIDGQVLRGGGAAESAKRSSDSTDAHKQQREEQRREKEAKLAHLDAALRMHAELITEEKHVEVDKTPGLLVSGADDDASASAGAAGEEASVQPARSAFNHRFLLTRDTDCASFDAHAVPYTEVVQNLQYMKSALGTRLASAEKSYLASLAALDASREEVAALREINRSKDLSSSAHSRVDQRLQKEFTALRTKLAESYTEVQKARAKNADMKRDMIKLGVSSAKDGKSSETSSGTKKGKPGALANRDAKKAYEDLVMSLKEKSDEIQQYTRAIEASNNEKDNLTTQVEILEQAVQTMRYMIKDILARISAQEGTAGKALAILTKGGQQAQQDAVASGTLSPTAATAAAAAAGAGAGHGRRSSLGALPPVAGSASLSSAAASALTDPASPRRLDKGFFRTEGTIATGLTAKSMIACRGFGPGVPRFLQYSGWVARYDLGKRHTELIIKEIWSLKTIADETRRKSGLKRTTLQDFFQRYLRSRFPSTTPQSLHRKMEFVYNFLESCTVRYKSDHDMDLFQKILLQGCSEERYIDSMTMMAHFKKALTQMDIIDGRRDGFIHKLVFFAGLRQFFPVKSEENSRALIEIVLREMQTRTTALVHNASLGVGVGGGIGVGGGSGNSAAGTSTREQGEMAVDISKLMAETSDGDESAFIDLIRNQYEEEINAFPLQIAAALTKASREVFGPTGIPPVQITWAGQGGHARGQSITHNSASAVAAAVRSASPSPYAGSNDNGPLFQSAVSASVGWLPAGQIAAILQELDANKSKHEIEALMRRGLGIDGYFDRQAQAQTQAQITGAVAATHAQVLREHKDSASAGSVATAASGTAHGRTGSHSSRSSTPQQQHHHRSPSSFTGSPHKESQPPPGHLLHKHSFSGGSSAMAPPSAGTGAGLSINLPRRESLGESSPSTPHQTQVLSSSGSSSGLLNPAMLLTNSRAQGRMSVGNGLAFAALNTATTAAPAHSSITPSSPSSPGSNAASAVAASSPSSTSGAAATASSPSAAGASSASKHHSRESSRRSSGSRVVGTMVLGADGRMRPPTSHSHSHSLSRSMSLLGGAAQGSYDPCQFVELSSFLERLNSLFLHRTGHYNADLDIAGLARLIKEELERVAEEERQARELAAAKKGLGTGLQVNAAALPSWAALWPSYKRVKDNIHLRDDVLAALVRKYSQRAAGSPTPSGSGEDEQRSSSRMSQSSTATSGTARMKSRAAGGSTHGRTSSTLSTRSASPVLSSPGSILDLLSSDSSSVESQFSVNPAFNSIVTFYRGDATKLQIDAVVNAANPQLVAGGGICAAIFSAAGHAQLSRACNKLGGCAYGQTKVTPAFKMPCRFLLHSVSPVDNTDSATLESCYNTILDCCLARGIRSVAMCCLATGIYGFRNVDAAEIALRTTRLWLDNHRDPATGAVPLERIVFCVFTEEDAVVYNTLLTIFFPCAPLSDKASASASPIGTDPETAQWPAMHASPSSSKKPALAIDTGSQSQQPAKKSLTFSQESMQRSNSSSTASILDAPAPSPPSPSNAASDKSVNPRRRSGKSLGSAPQGLGVTPPPLPGADSAASSSTPAVPSGVPNPNLFLPLRRAGASTGGAGSARSLRSYNYSLPPSLLPPVPRTASQLFSEGTLAPFVPPPPPPQPTQPVVPREGTKEYEAYRAQKSGAGAAGSSSAALVLAAQAPEGAQTGRAGQRKKGHTMSLHGLARLVRNDRSAEEDDD